MTDNFDKDIDRSPFLRELLSQDISGPGSLCDAVASPTSIEELSRVVARCAAEGRAIVPRGAGLSYTMGCVPTREDAVIIDLRAMDRILEINAEDMFVTVEAGTTWATLDAALRPLGLRTPYWGPLSGNWSTIGGAMSQNSVWWGSGLHGTAIDSVLCFDIVLADGAIVSTGSAGGVDGSAFSRAYGPDLTGLFGHDAGAFGIKAHVTLRLIPRPTAHRFVSHSFETAEAAFDAMSRISREQLASENFGFDPALTAINVVEGESDISRDLVRLFKVAKASGLRGAARVAFAGRRFAKAMSFGHHAIIEEYSDAAADEKLRRIGQICAGLGGRELEASVPRIALAEPFPPVAPAILRSKGERWLPRQTMVPHSQAKALLAAFETIVEEHADAIERLDIRIGYLCCTVSTNIFLIEPQCIWPDSHGLLHREIVGASVADKLPKQPDNPDARALVDAILGAFVTASARLGGTHLQIGKVYPYRSTRKPETGALIDSIKVALDPKRLMNPGALGL